MSETRLILHVKGTEAETTELPKEAVRAAVSQGQMGLSQLIWSPVNNAWKQVRELPELLPSERLILHVKGTETETKELPKQAVRAGISQGQITHSQLIWSVADNAWKQVRELPDLLPSQKLAPAPTRTASGSVPRIGSASTPDSPGGPVARAAATPQVRVAAAVPVAAPRVRVATASAGTPRVRVASASAGAPQVRVQAAVQPSVRSARSSVVEEEEGSHPVKWLCIGLGILILLVLGGNYILVDQPLTSGLGQTPYSNIKVYAHLGAFIQPNVMVIHIPASSNITSENLADFLAALAHGTPQNPMSHDFFDRVALTSGWTAQYSFSGGAWKELGDMTRESAAQRKEFLMTQIGDGNGQPLVAESTLNEEAQQARRDQVWAAFAAHFTAKQ